MLAKEEGSRPPEFEKSCGTLESILAPDKGFVSDGSSAPEALVSERGLALGEDSYDVENTVTEIKPTIPIYLRVRPVSVAQKKFITILSDDEVEILPSIMLGDSSDMKAERYKFTKVFGNSATQEDIYSNVAEPHVNQMFDLGNKSSLILAYGASGSGKAFSTRGKLNDVQGILHLVLETVLKRVGSAHTPLKVHPVRWSEVDISVPGNSGDSSKLETNPTLNPPNDTDKSSELIKGYEYAVFISFFEIYLDQVYDLQANYFPTDRKYQHYPMDARHKRPALQIRESANRRKYISDIIETRIYSMDRAREVIKTALTNRTTVETRVNSFSSRSHLVTTIKLVKVPLDGKGKQLIKDIHVGKLAIADLAGAERALQSIVGETGKKESGNINRSLHSFGMCLEALRECQKKSLKKPVIVPWRVCKLTLILQPYFECGNVSFIIHVNPSVYYNCVIGEVFRFARRAGALLQFRDVSPHYPNILNSMKEEIGNDLKRLSSTENSVNKCRSVESPRICDNAEYIEKKLGDVHKLHRDDLLMLADSVASYKKTIQEYEARLSGLEFSHDDRNQLGSKLSKLRTYNTYYNARSSIKDRLSARIEPLQKQPSAVKNKSGMDIPLSNIRKDSCVKIFDNLEHQFKTVYNRALDECNIDTVSYLKDRFARLLNYAGAKSNDERDADNINEVVSSSKIDQVSQYNLYENGCNLKSQVDSLKANNYSLSTSLQSIQEELTEAKSCINTLSEENSKKSQALDAVDTQLRTMVETISNKDELISSTNAKLDLINKESDARKERIETMKTENEMLKKQLDEEKEKLTFLSQDIFKSTKVAESLTNDLTLTKSQNKVLERLISSNETDIKQLSIKVEQLNKDNSKLQELILEEDKKSKECNDYAEALNIAFQKTKEELSIANANIEKLECDISSEKAENSRLHEIIKEKEVYIVSLKENNELISNVVECKDSKHNLDLVSEQKKGTSGELNKENPFQKDGQNIQRLENDKFIKQQLSEKQDKIEELNMVLESISGAIADKDLILQQLHLKLKDIENELAISKSKNIEKSLRLSEALFKIEDYRKREKDIVVAIRKTFPEFRDVETLQELIYTVKQIMVKGTLDADPTYVLQDDDHPLYDNYSSKSIRKSDIVRPSYCELLRQKVVRRLSELPISKETINKSVSYARDTTFQVDYSNNEDYRILSDILLDINSLSERLSNMDTIIIKYEKDEEKMEVEIQQLITQKTELDKELEHYKKANLELKKEVNALKATLSQPQLAPNALCLSADQHKKISSELLKLKSCLNDQINELEYFLKSEHCVVPLRKILELFIEESSQHLNCSKDSFSEILTSALNDENYIALYTNSTLSLFRLMCVSHEKVNYISEMLLDINILDQRCVPEDSSNIALKGFKDSLEKKVSKYDDIIRKFIGDFICKIRTLVINTSEFRTVFENIQTKMKELKVIMDNTEPEHSNDNITGVVVLDDMSQFVPSIHDLLDKLNSLLNELYSKVREGRMIKLENLKDTNETSKDCLNLDTNSVVTTSAALKKFLESGGNEPLSSFISQDSLTGSMLHAWSAMVVPLADRIYALVTAKSEEEKVLNDSSRKSVAGRVASVSECSVTSKRLSSPYASPKRVRKIEQFDEEDDELVEAPAIFDFSRKTSNSPSLFNYLSKSFGTAPFNPEGTTARRGIRSRLSVGNNSPNVKDSQNILPPISPNAKTKMEENFFPQKQKFKIDGAAWDAAIESEIKSSGTNSTVSSIPVLKKMRKLGKRKALEAERIEEENSEDEGYKGKRYSSIALRLEDN